MAHWEPTATGYDLTGGPVAATITRGKPWTVTVAGETHDLGRRPSFDHADAIVARASR